MHNKSILIPSIKYSEIIQLNEIVFLKADGSYSHVIMKNKTKVIISKNLHWFEHKIMNESFFRIHRSYLVNLTYISQIFQNDCKIKLKDGVIIPVSRSKKQELMKALESL